MPEVGFAPDVASFNARMSAEGGAKQATTTYHANLPQGACAKVGAERAAKRASKALGETGLEPNVVSECHGQ